MAKHRHLQLNIKGTMSAVRIRQDVARAFAMAPDSIVFNECTSVTRAAIHAKATELGYGVFVPEGAAAQVVIVWNAKRYRCTYMHATFAAKGKTHVGPNRYVVRVRLVDIVTGRTVSVVGTHMMSSGWTGSKWLDAWRQRAWYAHEAVMAAILRHVYARNDIVVWSGDLNRPPSTWRGAILPKYRVKGAATSTVVHTGHTHGRTTFDYTGVLAKRLHVTAHPLLRTFRSDHKGIVTDLSW